MQVALRISTIRAQNIRATALLAAGQSFVVDMIASTASSVLCGACGDVIPEDVAICTRCGTAREREPFFYSVPLVKLAVLGTSSFWFYFLWWFWSQFRAGAPNEGRGVALQSSVCFGC